MSTNIIYRSNLFKQKAETQLSGVITVKMLIHLDY